MNQSIPRRSLKLWGEKGRTLLCARKALVGKVFSFSILFRFSQVLSGSEAKQSWVLLGVVSSGSRWISSSVVLTVEARTLQNTELFTPNRSLCWRCKQNCGDNSLDWVLEKGGTSLIYSHAGLPEVLRCFHLWGGGEAHFCLWTGHWSMRAAPKLCPIYSLSLWTPEHVVSKSLGNCLVWGEGS